MEFWVVKNTKENFYYLNTAAFKKEYAISGYVSFSGKSWEQWQKEGRKVCFMKAIEIFEET